MKTTLLSLAVVALLGAAAAQDPGFPTDLARSDAEAALVGREAFRADQFIVRFVDGIDLAAARGLLDPRRYAVTEPLMPSIGLYLVRIADGTRVPDAIAELAPHTALRYAAPDHLVTLRGTVPNDPSYASQWCHTRMESDLAWDFGCGSSEFVVSVVDGGCLLTHSDLAANIHVNAAEAGGIPGVDDDGNGYVDDVNGWNAYGNNGNVPNDAHGTHVNAIVGAVGDNGIGVVGVNWQVTLMPVAGASSSTSTVTKAYNYVLAQKQAWLQSGGALGCNAVATNSSFGVDYANCNSPAYLPWNDAFDALGAVGILSCGATMNINANVDVTGDVPTGCASPFMIAVTNTTSSDVKNSGAAYGATTIDLGAPGTSIYSTYSNGGYTSMTGTSMASPQVAGAVALLHSVASTEFADLRDGNPALAALEIKDALLETVDPLPSLQGVTVSGGRLNLHRAAQAMDAWTASGLAGTVELYGPPPGGAHIGSLTSASVPNIGTTVMLDGSGFDDSVTLIFALALRDSSRPIAGGTLLVDLNSVVAIVSLPLSEGQATLGVWLPDSAAFVGFEVYNQCGANDATVPGGVALSNGLKFTIGM